MIATRAVTVRQQAKNLSSRCASYSPVAPKLAATPGMTRLASLVVEARTGSPAAVDKAMSAVRCVFMRFASIIPDDSTEPFCVLF